MGSQRNVWFALKKSLHCKSEAADVDDSISRKQLSRILTKKAAGTRRRRRSGCSRSIANLKDVIHGSKRHVADQKPTGCSPRSVGSNEFRNPITHEVILTNSRCELKIAAGGGGVNDGGHGSTFVGTLRPGTPGPGGYPAMHYFSRSLGNSATTTPRKSPFLNFSGREKGSGYGVFGGGNGGGGHSSGRVSLEMDANGSSKLTCHKCGHKFTKWESAENHHLSKHSVTELVEGDSSRKIVEIICRTSWLKNENHNHCGRIERVLKVHNMQKTLARFEEYREMVKIKAGKLSKKHPRCIADGNELLRFHGTTLSCFLGINGCSSLCTSEKCRVCRIIRNGFSSKREIKGGIGVFTTSTSRRAYECVEIFEEEDPFARKALIVCRVIAGRVHRAVENLQEISGQTGFDSLAGKVGICSNIEELYLLNPRALLPCFVVICKP